MNEFTNSDLVVKKIDDLKFWQSKRNGYYMGKGWAIMNKKNNCWLAFADDGEYPYVPRGGRSTAKLVAETIDCVAAADDIHWVRSMED